MNSKISIIMPAYNEGERIFENISTTRSVALEADLDAEIVVVDDGSEDNTLSEIECAAREFDNVIATRNPYNMGKGMALRTGFDHCSGEIVVFLDADLDLHPSQILILLNELEQGPYDIVVTSKHHPDSQLLYPLKRKIASNVYYMIVKILFGLPVRDTQTGLKVYRRKVLDDIFHRLLVKTYAYDVELLATAIRFGFTVREIPVVLNFRRGVNWGRINFRDVVRIFIDTLAIFYRLRLLRYYDAERALWVKEDKPVLVVSRGAPPNEEIVRRLCVNKNVRVAYLTDENSTERAPESILRFKTEDALKIWLSRDENKCDLIGFISPSSIPLGTWVKNALRNFRDINVIAVSGPVVAAPHKSFLGKVSAMLYNSILTSGPNNYLRSIQRVKTVKKALMDNIFIRSSLFMDTITGDGTFYISNGLLFDISHADLSVKYDPDVAVSKEVPPLFLPYIKHVALESFSDGCTFGGRPIRSNRLWLVSPILLWLIIIFGWMIIPLKFYIAFLGIYAAIIIITGLIYFSPLSLPLFFIGILLDHFVRAVALPVGLIKRILER